MPLHDPEVDRIRDAIEITRKRRRDHDRAAIDWWEQQKHRPPDPGRTLTGTDALTAAELRAWRKREERGG